MEERENFLNVSREFQDDAGQRGNGGSDGRKLLFTLSGNNGESLETLCCLGEDFLGNEMTARGEERSTNWADRQSGGGEVRFHQLFQRRIAS